MKNLVLFILFGFAMFASSRHAHAAADQTPNSNAPIRTETKNKISVTLTAARQQQSQGKADDVATEVTTNAPPELPLQQLDEIRVSDSIAPREKPPILKLREALENSANEARDSVRENSASDGARFAQVNIGGKKYCIEERRGLIDIAGLHDFSGLNKKPPLMSPMLGQKCRWGQY